MKCNIVCLLLVLFQTLKVIGDDVVPISTNFVNNNKNDKDYFHASEIIINTAGKLIGKCFFEIKWFDLRQKIICTQNIITKKTCIRNDKWEKISDWYSEIHKFSEGLAGFCNGNKFGYINTKGEKVIPAVFDGIQAFSDGVAEVTIKEKVRSDLGFGHFTVYINKAGEVAFPGKYLRASQFKNGIAYVTDFISGKSGYIDKKGKFVLTNKQIESEGYSLISCSEGMFEIKNSKGKIGFINSKGDIIFSPQFDAYLSVFYKGLAVVSFKSNICLINNKGNIIAQKKKKYMQIGGFSEGLSPVILLNSPKRVAHSLLGSTKKSNSNHDNSKYLSDNIEKIGFIDRQFNLKIPLLFQDAKEFINGFAAVKMNGKWGFINKKGHFVVNPVYDKIIYGFL